MIFRPLAISNSHVINAGRSGPLHLRQVRGTASFSKWKLKIKDLVGAGRFERPTPCAQGRCATRLRYAPTGVALFILKHFSRRGVKRLNIAPP